MFNNARRRADHIGSRGEQSIFRMMKDIGEELQAFAGIYTPSVTQKRPINVLDICMAPGGYSAVALKYNPRGHVYGITLPEERGGHPIVLEVKEKLYGIKYCDLTMLVSMRK